MNVEGMSQEIRGARNLEKRAGDGFEEETRRGARQRREGWRSSHNL